MRRQLAVIVLALAAFVAPLPASAVERLYSRGLFAHLQPVVTASSNLTALAWLDGLLILATLVVLWWVSAAVRARRSPGRGIGRLVLRLTTLVAAAYLAFLVLWGLNYRREPFARRTPYVAARVTPDAAATLARETVRQINALHPEAHASGWLPLERIDPVLSAAFSQTLTRLGLLARVEPGRPKRSMLDLYFRRAAVAGMTDPIFLETLVASDTLPFERPQVIAHEWAHLAGITNEGEANFVGWLACVNGAASHRYSGWLFLYSELIGTLPTALARDLRNSVDPGPTEDLRAIRARYEREVSPRLSGAGWQVYDSYLKANRVEAGTASYAEVVRLILASDLR